MWSWSNIIKILTVILMLSIIFGSAAYLGASLQNDIADKKTRDSLNIEKIKIEIELAKLEIKEYYK